MAIILIDANVFLSALIKDSITRKIIIYTNHIFLFPEEMMSEIRKYQELVLQKTSLNREGYQTVLQIILQHIYLISWEGYKSFYFEAERIMKDIDEKDIDYLACAMAMEVDFI
tara:strand:+ start:103 stop:441 length:339 start_codon:yes stop_codon:yes gene_type:complete